MPVGFSGSRKIGCKAFWWSIAFVGVMAIMAAAGSIVGSQFMKTRISNAQLKKSLVCYSD
jgi:hypothetical protein